MYQTLTLMDKYKSRMLWTWNRLIFTTYPPGSQGRTEEVKVHENHRQLRATAELKKTECCQGPSATLCKKKQNKKTAMVLLLECEIGGEIQSAIYLEDYIWKNTHAMHEKPLGRGSRS